MGNGSVVLDSNNTSGLGTVVALYTLNSTVALAGSVDGGYTFSPAGTVNVRGRDPRVSRVGSEWILAVARDSRVAFYTSTDLKSWTYASDFAGSGGRLAAPSLAKVGDNYLLIVTTTDAPLGGETQVYYVGEFASGTFTPSSGPTPVEWGKDASGGILDPSGIVAISWANNVQYAARVPTASESWRGALTLPRAVSLVKGDSGTTLALAPYNLDSARGDQLASAHGDGTWKWAAGLNTSASGAVLLEINVTAGATLKYTFSGGGSVSGGLDSELWIDRTNARNFNSSSFTSRLSTPWQARNATLLVVVDRSVLEVFVDGTAATAVFYPSSPLTELQLAANGAVSAALWDLHAGFEGDGTGNVVRRRWRKRGGGAALDGVTG